MFERSFSKKDLAEAAYILSIKIYRDRSRRLIRLSMSTYLDKIFEEVQNGPVKESVLSCIARYEVSKTQNPTTAEDRERE